MTSTPRLFTIDSATHQWGDWHGSFATAAAAKRYLTVVWTGPKVPDRYNASEVRVRPDGRWEVRVGEWGADS